MSKKNENLTDLVCATTDSKEFLIFRLGDREYGFDIQYVIQLRGYGNVTTIPNAPRYIKGVINLHGGLVQINDLRTQFNIGDPVYNEFTVVIILSMHGKTFGFVVDSVADVIQFTAEQVRPMPSFDALGDTGLFAGIGTIDTRVVVLFDAVKLMLDSALPPDAEFYSHTL